MYIMEAWYEGGTLAQLYAAHFMYSPQMATRAIGLYMIAVVAHAFIVDFHRPSLPVAKDRFEDIKLRCG